MPFFQRSAENIDRKSTRLNSSHLRISYAVFCLKKEERRSEEHTSELQSPQNIVCRLLLEKTDISLRASNSARCCSAWLTIIRNLSYQKGRPGTSLRFLDTILRLFFFNDTATTEIYTLSLHDALPICAVSTSLTRTGPMYCMSAPINCANADRKSTRLNSSHDDISYAVFCLKKYSDAAFTRIAFSSRVWVRMPLLAALRI